MSVNLAVLVVTFLLSNFRGFSAFFRKRKNESWIRYGLDYWILYFFQNIMKLFPLLGMLSVLWNIIIILENWKIHTLTILLLECRIARLVTSSLSFKIDCFGSNHGLHCSRNYPGNAKVCVLDLDVLNHAVLYQGHIIM